MKAQAFPRIHYRGGFYPWVIRYEDNAYRSFETRSEAESWLDYEATPYDCGPSDSPSDADPGL